MPRRKPTDFSRGPTRTSDRAILALPKLARERLASYAPNSQRALKADWRVWYRWCVDPQCHPDRRRRSPLPITGPALIEFIKALSPPIIKRSDGSFVTDTRISGGRIRGANTLSRYLSSLRALHRLSGYQDDPTKDVDVETTRRIVMRGRRGAKPKRPLRFDLVERALRARCKGIRDARDQALLAVAYCGMLRRSELVGLEVADISWDETDDSALITVQCSKTDQAGVGRTCYLAPFAARALRKWLKQAEITAGPLFRRIAAGGRPGANALLGKEVARIVKRTLRRIGLTEAEVAGFAGHSARIGAAHDLVIGGYDIAAVMLAGGWASPAMPAHYTREIRAKENAIAQMLGSLPARPGPARRTARPFARSSGGAMKRVAQPSR